MFLTSESSANFRNLVEALKRGPVTAFIGAGLSASMQPTWSALHATLQRESGLEPARDFNPAFAPADFADFRDAMPAELYVGVLKQQFGGVVTDYPNLYRVIDETNGFDQLVTTNYDEFLATVALSNNRHPRIAAYPNFGDLRARYVYLHGRAETATLPSDLVLCEDDYGRAYEVQGRAKHMLRALFGRPGVFIGSSLQDPDLLALLRQRTRLSGDAGPDALPTLFAVVPVKPAGESEGEFGAAAEVMTRRLRRLGVWAICYASDRAHTELRAVLLQLRHEAERRPVEALFLDRTRQLNRLGAVEAPTPEDVERVRDLIRGVPELARHFFELSATSPAWYDALKESVIVPGVVEPWDLGDRARQIGPWAAAPYIQRIAPERPEVVVDLIRRHGATTNWHAQSVLGRLAAHLPDDRLQEALPIVARWMEDPNESFNRVAESLAVLPERLAEHGCWDLAFEVLGLLLTPMREALQGEGPLRVNDYWFPRLKRPLEQLMDDRTEPTYRMLKTRLLELLANSDSADFSSIWRPAIEDNDQNFTEHHPALHFLTETTRDALLAWTRSESEEVTAELQSLLSSDIAFLGRLALHALIVFPRLLQRLPDPVLTETILLGSDYFHELAVLLNGSWELLDAASRDLVHWVIREGPELPESATEERRTRMLQRHRWHLLAVIPREHHSDEERVWWDDLVQLWGVPEHTFFLHWHEPGTFHAVEPPVAAEDPLRSAWQSGGAHALAEALRAAEGWWEPLRRLVEEDPSGLLNLAPVLEPTDGKRLVTFFEAYRELLANHGATTSFDWLPLIDLMERLSEADLGELGGVPSAIARLIEQAVVSEYNVLPADLLERAMGVTARLVGALGQPLATPPEQGGRIGPHHQLNHPAGQAADAFMCCAWQMLYLAAEGERELPHAARPWFEVAVEQGWGGLEFRHALGEFWFVLHWADRGWLSRHIEVLWPGDQMNGAVNAQRAFLYGFLHTSQWSRSALEALRPMFRDCIRDLGREQPLYFDERQFAEPFVRSLVRGWLYDVDGYGFDGLLGEFVDGAPDPERARFVQLLGQEHRLTAAKDAVDFRLTNEKRDEYWQRRIADLGPRLPVAERSEELSAFCSWARHASLTLRQLEGRLNVSIDHLAQGPAATDLLRYITARGEAEPLPAARLLLRLVDRLLGDENLYVGWRRTELETALDAICLGARPGHRSLVRQIADRLSRDNVLDYSTKLRNCGRTS